MRRRVLVACSIPVAAIVSSCLGPTQIMVDVQTNACNNLTRVDFYVNEASTSSPGTSATSCSSTPPEVGTLSIVPSGAIDSRVQVDIVGALNNAVCPSPSTLDPNCIVAKRELAFIPHTRLDLPIFLDARCAGFSCPDGTTCVADQSGPHCTGVTCDVDGGVQCTADGGTVPAPDVSVLDAISPACKPVIDAGAPLLSWSFNLNTDKKIHEDKDQVVAQSLSGGSILPTGGECGSYLTASSPQIVSPGDTRFDTDTLIFAFAYQAVADGNILQLASAGPGGFTISMNNGVVNVVFMISQTAQLSVFQDTKQTNDGQWHTFEMYILTNGTGDGGAQKQSATFYRDGAPISVSSPTTYVATQGPLFAGPILGIDQIEYFAP